MVDNAVVIVTGASSGMGAATARWLAIRKVRVVLAARSEKKLLEVAGQVKKLGGEPHVVVCDVSDAMDCKKVVKTTLNKFKRLDGLVNNAGIIAPISPIGQCEIDQFEKNIAVNLLGPFYLVRAAIDQLRENQGRVVNVSSGAAVEPVAAWGAYCAAKAALTHLTRVMAEEEPEIVSVAVRPGVVDTPMQEKIRKEGPGAMPEELSSYFLNLKEKGKLEPAHVPARSIAWLALRASADMSGKLVDYDDEKIAQPAMELFGREPV